MSTHTRLRGMGITSFTDPYGGPVETAAEAGATAAAMVEAAKAKKVSADAAAAAVAYAQKRAVEEALAKTQESNTVPVVEVGVDTGKILGMDKGVVLLIAGAGALWMLNQKG